MRIRYYGTIDTVVAAGGDGGRKIWKDYEGTRQKGYREVSGYD